MSHRSNTPAPVPVPDNVALALEKRCAACPTKAEVTKALGAISFAKWLGPVIYIISAAAFAGYVRYTVAAELDKRLPAPRLDIPTLPHVAAKGPTP